MLSKFDLNYMSKDKLVFVQVKIMPFDEYAQLILTLPVQINTIEQYFANM
jgi:hypothetical protein